MDCATHTPFRLLTKLGLSPVAKCHRSQNVATGGRILLPDAVTKCGHNHTDPLNQNKRGELPEELPLELPDVLNTPAFRAAWAEWVQHRKEIRKKLTDTSVKRQLAMLERIGHDQAIRTIGHTVERGWIGLREPDPKRFVGSAGGNREYAEPPKRIPRLN